MKKLILLLVFIPMILSAQWRTAHESWDTRQGTIIKSDKIEHMAWMSTTNLLLDLVLPSQQKHNWKYTLLIGVANEVKDALLPFEKHGAIGGEGWSWKDTACNILGVVIYQFFKWLLF